MPKPKENKGKFIEEKIEEFKEGFVRQDEEFGQKIFGGSPAQLEEFLKKSLNEAWEAGRGSVIEEIEHEQKKMLDGFGHNCELCKLQTNEHKPKN